MSRPVFWGRFQQGSSCTASRASGTALWARGRNSRVIPSYTYMLTIEERVCQCKWHQWETPGDPDSNNENNSGLIKGGKDFKRISGESVKTEPANDDQIKADRQWFKLKTTAHKWNQNWNHPETCKTDNQHSTINRRRRKENPKLRTRSITREPSSDPHHQHTHQNRHNVEWSVG